MTTNDFAAAQADWPSSSRTDAKLRIRAIYADARSKIDAEERKMLAANTDHPKA